MGNILGSIAMKIIAGLLTEKVIKKVVIELLKFLVSKTTNDLDDKLAAPIIEALSDK